MQYTYIEESDDDDTETAAEFEKKDVIALTEIESGGVTDKKE